MKIFVFCSLGVLVGILLFVWLVTRIRYRIGSRHVKVLLFGLCLRRVALVNIESISKRRGDGWAENWSSTLHPKHRMLVLRRRRGLFRNFVVTPKNRYIFKTDLERAMRRVGAALDQSESKDAPTDALDVPAPEELATEDHSTADRGEPLPESKSETRDPKPEAREI
jgi:hypothetical protein